MQLLGDGMKRYLVILSFVIIISSVCGISAYAANDTDELDIIGSQDGDEYNESSFANEIPEEFQAFFNNPDYEVYQADDGQGNMTWYLVNNIDNTRVKISEFNNIVSSAEEREGKIAELEKSVTKWKVLFWGAVALLGVVIAIFEKRLADLRRKKSKDKTSQRKKTGSAKAKLNMKDFVEHGAIRYEDNDTE